MKIFENKCLVFVIWKSKHKQIELCLFRPYCEVDWHYHEHSHIELMHLWGIAHYFRKHNGEHKVHLATFCDIGKKFSIPPLAVHAALIGMLGLITLSIQTWKKDVEVTTVVKDFHYES